jgi:hypothetical protein
MLIPQIEKSAASKNPTALLINSWILPRSIIFNALLAFPTDTSPLAKTNKPLFVGLEKAGIATATSIGDYERSPLVE